MSLKPGVIRIAVCDDEEPFRRSLSSSIEKYYKDKNIMVDVKAFESGEELLLPGSGTVDYDVVFLDVEMGDEGGFGTARRIRKLNEKIPIVFITAILNSWNVGYEVGAFRYIIKDPRTYDDLLTECLDSLTNKFFWGSATMLLDTTVGTKQILVKDLVYVESRAHILLFYILGPNGIVSYHTKGKLSSIEHFLSDKDFIRIHQSFLVNLAYIDKTINYKAILYCSDEELPISRWKFKEVKSVVLALKGAI